MMPKQGGGSEPKKTEHLKHSETFALLLEEIFLAHLTGFNTAAPILVNDSPKGAMMSQLAPIVR